MRPNVLNLEGRGSGREGGVTEERMYGIHYSVNYFLN